MKQRYFTALIAAWTAACLTIAAANLDFAGSDSETGQKPNPILKSPPVLSVEMQEKINDFIEKHPQILKTFTLDGTPKYSFPCIIFHDFNSKKGSRVIPDGEMNLFITHDRYAHDLTLEFYNQLKDKIDSLHGSGFFDGLQIECWKRLDIKNPIEPKKYIPPEKPGILQDAVEGGKDLIKQGWDFIFN